MKLSRYCICGAAMQVSAEPPELAERLAEMFDVRHRGSGHAPCTAAQAGRVRRTNERRWLREQLASGGEAARVAPPKDLGCRCEHEGPCDCTCCAEPGPVPKDGTDG